MMRLGAPASLIEYNNMKFVITYMPDRISAGHYVKDLQQYQTGKLVRTCKVTTGSEIFYSFGISVNELEYPDGTFPHTDIIEQWLKIVKQHFQKNPRTALAVHCCSGLGRSAVLVAVALMESGMKPQDAIENIRLKRRGAFNTLQTEEIVKYKSKNRLVEKAKYFHRFSTKKKNTDGTIYNKMSYSNQSI